MDPYLYTNQLLAASLFEGTLSRAGERELQAWLIQDQTHVEQLRTWDILWQQSDRQDDRVDALWNDFQKLLPYSSVSSVIPLWHRPMVRWAAAACCVIVLIVFAFCNYLRPTAMLENDLIAQTYVQTGAHATNVELPDGSQVTLNMGSQLSWVSNRHVQLSGEAWFEVQSDTAHPFTVEVQDMTITVTGTTFNVSAYSNERSRLVSLLQGRVVVTCGDNQVVLRPNEQVRLSQGTCEMHVEPCDAQLAGLWREGRMDYEAIALDELLMRLSRMYHTPIALNSSRTWPTIRFVMYSRHDLNNILMGLEEVYPIQVVKTDEGYRVN